jgi:hypothetical protein
MTKSGLQPDDRMRAATGIVGDCADAASVATREGTIVAWNAAASELFGIATWDASAQSCAVVVQGCMVSGEAICRAGCPLLIGSTSAPRSVAMLIPRGRLGPGRAVHVHHLPIKDPRLGTIAMLHLVDPDPGPPLPGPLSLPRAAGPP